MTCRSSPVMPLALGAYPGPPGRSVFPHFEGRYGMFAETEGSALPPWPRSSVRYGIRFQKFPWWFQLSVLFSLLPVLGADAVRLQAAVTALVSCPQLPLVLWNLLQRSSESGLKMNLWECLLPVSGVFEGLGPVCQLLGNRLAILLLRSAAGGSQLQTVE